MNKLSIDLDYLLFAWQDDSPDTAYYLDCDTGSVLLVQRDLDDLDGLRDEIELQPSRFLYVPKPDPEQIELDMGDFIYTVPDARLKDILSMAFESPAGKVGACRKVLAGQQAELERWEKFRLDAVRERVRRWLAANNILAE